MIEPDSDDDGEEIDGSSLEASGDAPFNRDWMPGYADSPWASDRIHTLNRKCMTSPSRTMYSFPSKRSFAGITCPASPLPGNVVREGDHLGPMKPCSKSV